VSLILDAGAFIAYKRGDDAVRAFLERAERTETTVATTTGVVAQVWRTPATQVRLVRLLRGVEEAELSGPAARAVGILLREAATSDVVDASIIDLAQDGDEVLTSDPDDIELLAAAAGKTLIVTPMD
jgi:hypothetical protein